MPRPWRGQQATAGGSHRRLSRGRHCHPTPVVSGARGGCGAERAGARAPPAPHSGALVGLRSAGAGRGDAGRADPLSCRVLVLGQPASQARLPADPDLGRAFQLPLFPVRGPRVLAVAEARRDLCVRLGSAAADRRRRRRAAAQRDLHRPRLCARPSALSLHAADDRRRDLDAVDLQRQLWRAEIRARGERPRRSGLSSGSSPTTSCSP